MLLNAGYSGDDVLTAELKAFLKTKLAHYKVPRSIEYLRELPKTPTGKIQRHLLRDRERERKTVS